MLKIKADANLKELEKFKFRRYGYFYTRYIDDHNAIIIDKSTRKIEIDCAVKFSSLNRYNNIIFDLIRAGLVEKVGE